MEKYRSRIGMRRKNTQMCSAGHPSLRRRQCERPLYPGYQASLVVYHRRQANVSSVVKWRGICQARPRELDPARKGRELSGRSLRARCLSHLKDPTIFIRSMERPTSEDIGIRIVVSTCPDISQIVCICVSVLIKICHNLTSTREGKTLECAVQAIQHNAPCLNNQLSGSYRCLRSSIIPAFPCVCVVLQKTSIEGIWAPGVKQLQSIPHRAIVVFNFFRIPYLVVHGKLRGSDYSKVHLGLVVLFLPLRNQPADTRVL